jgi:two-component system nitrate/nitrite response regulator NarL
MNGQLTVVDARLWSTEMELTLHVSPPIQNDSSWGSLADGESHLFKQLSAREIAILERIVRGDSNKHVARHFKIAEPTVKAHVKAIFRKIGANNRTQAAIWAMNHHQTASDTTGELVTHSATGEIHAGSSTV